MKMEKVIYSKNGGLGIILDLVDKECDYFDDATFVLNGTDLFTEDDTTLCGLFDRPVRFVGSLRDDPMCMVFYLGHQSDLFDSKRYYSCYYWISDTRIFNKYTESSGRDFNLVNGKWK